MKRLFFVSILFLFSQFIFAQYQIGLVPRTSPDCEVYKKVGFTEIRITYGSPSVNDRKIWGELVPYSQLWRAGANNATTVEFSTDVNIGEMPLDSGKYSFFVIPEAVGDWTVIFNRIEKQWGAFRYNQAEDALRIGIAPEYVDTLVEQLEYSINHIDFERASITLSWSTAKIEIPIVIDYLSEFRSLVENRADLQPDYLKWIVFLQGAEHLNTIEKDQELAMDWINKAEDLMKETIEWDEQFYPRPYVEGHLYWTKANTLASMNKFLEAADYLEKLKSMENNNFYNKENEDLEIDAQLENWGSR